jgi:5-methylcytosine-specific restriction enzyme subunit McrC
MATLKTLADALAVQGLARSTGEDREEISIVEHGEAILPSDIIRSDGSFDLYDDVQTKFEIEYKRKQNRLIIRGGGWVGYVPLNDRYALRIDTRVPVTNLEQIISRSTSTKIEVLGRYSHIYGHSEEKPQSLYDIITDQFLTALDLIWREGLVKTYRDERMSSSMPFGRIDPLRTALRQEKSRKPDAVFSAFFRTNDFGPNRALKAALERLNIAYRTLENYDSQANRIRRIRSALSHFEGVADATNDELSTEATEKYIRRLPEHRTAYNDALRLAHLIVNDVGFALRDGQGLATLPVVLVDMADIFESYAREVLRRELARDPSLKVLDGNLSGLEGAKRDLFSRFDIDGSNPSATPDIVIESDGKPLAVIDVKYKPSKKIPERAEINQIMCYGARYRCNKVMILYPQPVKNQNAVCSLGMVGETQVFRASLDLEAADLGFEESAFGAAILQQIRGHGG